MSPSSGTWIFHTIVFSCFDGMSREGGRFISHTAERLANRRKEPKNMISAWIKADLSLNSKHASVFAWNKNTLKC